MSFELDWSAIVAGALGLMASAVGYGAQRQKLVNLQEAQKAMEARLDKVEQLVQAVTSLGPQLSQSIKHLGETFASEMKHMSELQANHNSAVTQQLNEIKEEQRSFRTTPRQTTRRQTT